MTARRIRDEMIVAEHPILKRRTLFVLPVIPTETAPYAVREGIARRRIAATTGQCPCGAVADYGDPQPGEVGTGEVRHERGCPAVTDKLLKVCRRWAS